MASTRNQRNLLENLRKFLPRASPALGTIKLSVFLFVCADMMVTIVSLSAVIISLLIFILGIIYLRRYEYSSVNSKLKVR